MKESMDEILESAAALELGIVPPSIMQTSPDPFKNLSPEEQRAAKRKFRKIKRKLAPTSLVTGKKSTDRVTMWQIKEYLLKMSEGICP